MNIKNIKQTALILGISISGLIGSTYAIGTAPTLTNVNVNNGDILVKDIINNLQENIVKLYNWIKGGFTVNGNIKLTGTKDRGLVLEVNSHTWDITQDTANALLINKDSSNIFKLTDSNSILNVPLSIASMLTIDGDGKKGFIKNNDGTIEIRTEDNNDDGIVLVSNGHDVANFKKSGVVIDSSDISLKATGTNKGLRIKSDGSVCMGACW